MICLVYGYLAVTWGVPFYASNWGNDTALKVLGVAGLIVWIAAAVWDGRHDEVPNDRQHPNSWSPIWTASVR